MTVTVRGPGDPGPEAVELVAFSGEAVTLAPEARRAVQAARDEAVAVLAGTGRVYGVTTRLGHRASEDVTRNPAPGGPRRGAQAGGGEPPPATGPGRPCVPGGRRHGARAGRTR